MKPVFFSFSMTLGVLLVTGAWAEDAVRINPTDPQPTCIMCPGTYIPAAELESYTRKAIEEKLIDQQVRDIDIGKARVGIGMVHRGRLEKPAANSVAEHDQISEIYHVISGAATLVLGPDSSTGSADLRPCALSSNSTVPATRALKFATALPMRSRLATSS
jgi:hypothetical protein